jgi:hypothetical protein
MLCPALRCSALRCAALLTMPTYHVARQRPICCVHALCVLTCQVVYEIPSPGPVARLEILRYHSRNKQLEEDSQLTRVAEVTQVRTRAC